MATGNLAASNSWHPSFHSLPLAIQQNQNNQKSYCILPLQHCNISKVSYFHFRGAGFLNKRQGWLQKERQTRRQRCCKHNKPFVSCCTQAANPANWHPGSKPSKLAPRQLCNPVRQHGWHQPLLKKGTVLVTYNSYCSKINLARSLEISRI